MCAQDRSSRGASTGRRGADPGPAPEVILRWLRGRPVPIAVVHEAGPTGFGLASFLAAEGIRCVVAAPSKLQRRSGDRVKTDAKDALHLARLLRLGEIVPVAVRRWNGKRRGIWSWPVKTSAGI